MTPRFSNPDPSHRPHGLGSILRWGIWDPLLGRRRTAPPGPPAPRVEPDLVRITEPSSWPQITWVGHAGFLVQMGGRSVLIDPLFSNRVGWIYKRYGCPGILPEHLPPLDAVLVTHNHYDHLDLASLKAVAPTVPLFVPSGLGRYLQRRLSHPVEELDWWQAEELGEIRISLVPSRHWSRRRLFDTNRTLWGGFVLEIGDRAIYHAGDSAWFDGFREIGERFPNLLAAILPIGGYRPAWFMEHHHLNPEQAGEAFVHLGARWLIPMHWGALQLTDEPLMEPVDRLRDWWRQNQLEGGRELGILKVGETVVLET